MSKEKTAMVLEHPAIDDGQVGDLGRIAEFMRVALHQKKCGRDFAIGIQNEAGGHTVITSREIDPKLSLEEALGTVSSLAAQFYDAAIATIRCHVVPQTFIVSAYDKHHQSYSTVPFKLFPPGSNDIGALVSSASERGVLEQSMGLTQVMARHAIGAKESEVDRMERLLDRQAIRITELEASIREYDQRRFAQFEATESLLSRAHERALATKNSDAQIALLEKGAEKLWKIGGNLATIVAKKHGFDLPAGFLEGSATPLALPSASGVPAVRKTCHVVKELFASITNEQSAAISNLFTTQQGMLLMQSIDLAEKEVAAEEAAVASANKAA